MHSREGLGELFVVATPIGNLKDITLRALEVLKEVPVIACEDTRRALKLLSHYGISGKRLIPYHEHNEREAAEKILNLLKDGVSVALISDAGTPTISDPGYRLVKRAREEGVKVVPIPGASAVIAALSASGLPTDKFLFYGFLPRKEGKLRSALEEIISYPFTVVAYESPHRIERTLELLSQIAPDVELVIGRELTKLNEDFLFGSPHRLLEELREGGKLRGEFVLLFPPSQDSRGGDEVEIEELLKKLKEDGYSMKEAVKEVKERLNLPKREVYSKALEIFKGKN
ncbi:16S rRNA (cytidine(1402)-2'-O)-methyltransferase [Thermovibrio sp.]